MNFIFNFLKVGTDLKSRPKPNPRSADHFGSLLVRLTPVALALALGVTAAHVSQADGAGEAGVDSPASAAFADGVTTITLGPEQTKPLSLFIRKTRKALEDALSSASGMSADDSAKNLRSAIQAAVQTSFSGNQKLSELPLRHVLNQALICTGARVAPTSDLNLSSALVSAARSEAQADAHLFFNSIPRSLQTLIYRDSIQLALEILTSIGASGEASESSAGQNLPSLIALPFADVAYSRLALALKWGNALSTSHLVRFRFEKLSLQHFFNTLAAAENTQQSLYSSVLLDTQNLLQSTSVDTSSPDASQNLGRLTRRLRSFSAKLLKERPMVQGGGTPLLPVPSPSSGLQAVQISAGRNFSCALLTSGKVKCWGDNGNDRVSSASTISDATAISAGGSHSCALLRSGKVQCWGYDSFGRVSGAIEVSSATAISAGEYHSCALLRSEKVQCWGYNGEGQVSGANEVSGATAISSGWAHSCALLRSGKVQCWGLDNFGRVSGANEVSGASAISAGGYHSCALLRSGKVQCWGYDELGQVSRADAISGASAVSAGRFHSCALLRSGKVQCWGNDDHGQTSGASAILGAIAVSAGFEHSCALLRSGKVQCWGIGSGTEVPPELRP